MKSKWFEIRIDFFCEDDGLWRVDAWKTYDGDEEGKVIALINNETKVVTYIDNVARIDEYAQAEIKEFIDWLEEDQ